MLNRLAKILAVLFVMIVLTGLIVGAVIPGLLALRDDGVDGSAVVEAAAFPVAIVEVTDGAFVYAERQTGAIRLVRGDGQLEPRPVASVPVTADGQRGLLGLARTGTGDEARLFAAWTRPDDGRLVVGQVFPGEPRLIWEGPVSVERGNGGHLDVSPLGELVIGIGDAGAADLIEDPDEPNGKMLALDPDGEVDQTPEVLSSGWRNPFAFAHDDDGRLWVADNAPPGQAERIGVGDKEDGPLLELDENLAPSALIVLDDGDLGVCGFLDGQMRQVAVDRGGGPGTDPTAELTEDVVVEPCTVAAAQLSDGSTLFATTTEIRRQDP
jgi:hypothetical protein